MNRTTKIPVTIITGFLGAGKTTLINKLLQKYSGTQFALVENEFGDVAIDTKLIKGVDASQMFELKQGCICCSISDEFELVLLELAERFPNVEHLLIETTGVADPASVIRPFFTDEKLQTIYKYNGTICLVDALNFNNQTEKDLRIKQLVVADRAIISKAENWTENQKSKFQLQLQKINPFAKITIALSVGAEEFEIDLILKKNRTLSDFIGFKQSHSNFQTKTQSFSHLINKEEFMNWLSYTLDIYKNLIYRTKGILCFENEPYEYILQGVGGSFEITEGDLILDETNSVVVFIGNLENLDLEFNFLPQKHHPKRKNNHRQESA